VHGKAVCIFHPKPAHASTTLQNGCGQLNAHCPLLDTDILIGMKRAVLLVVIVDKVNQTSFPVYDNSFNGESAHGLSVESTGGRSLLSAATCPQILLNPSLWVITKAIN
jgi:hypothetical protein